MTCNCKTFPVTLRYLRLIPARKRYLTLLLCILSTAMAVNNSSTDFGQIRLDCGASTTKGFDSDNRAWDCDYGSRFAPSLKGVAATASQDPELPSTIPYMTSRIFTSNYTYSFAVRPGRLFVRLYIFPSTYGRHSPSRAYFGVAANNLILLKNFSASQTTLALNKFGSFVHEYYITVTSKRLELTFSPSTYPNGSYAFVNGIEIVPTPDLFTTPMATLVTGLSPIPFPIDSATRFQRMYRLNVGGDDIPPRYDVSFYRSWDDDSSYIYAAGYGLPIQKDSKVTITYTTSVPNYTAPVDVYATARSMGTNEQINMNYNLTWVLPVDAGFCYLVRLHFCDMQYPVTELNRSSFSIYINNQTAEGLMDVLVASGGIGKTVYRDYVTVITGFGQVDLLVALHPADISSRVVFYDAILNGLEIFKLQTDGDFNTRLPLSPNVEQSEPSDGRTSNIAAISGSVGGIVVVIIACISVCIFCQQKTKTVLEYITTKESITRVVKYNMMPSNICSHITFKEIVAATRNFDENFLLGKGGFGNVYCGKMDSGIKVAIKRGNPVSQQGLHEFRTEIETLSLLRHRHLVSLIGYCEENNEMILVYDHMANGTLREHLYDTKNSPLAWKQRLEICIGAAQGLHYLHAGAKQTIIHRDVKTANILLDDKFIAKVSDFGLSKASLDIDDTHVSTVVKGTFGYLDPEYFRRKQLTQKSDVYSFGVVLFEVLCARPVVNIELPDEQVSLRDWALSCQNRGVLNEIIDPHLQGEITPECFRMFVETAERCVAERSIDRPLMGDVLQSLQLALQLQESTRDNRSHVEATSSLVKTCVASANPSTDTTMSIAGQGAVYSDIAHTEGR